jgi:hypothetical protein
MHARHSRIACIGLRARTARAIVVVVSGAGSSPHAVNRAEIVLGTLHTPALFQPYHEVMELPWEQAVVATREAERMLEAIAAQRLQALLHDLRDAGLEIASVAIVGAPDRNPQAIGNPHIRAHSAEGMLFRHVWQVAAEAVGVPFAAFPENGFASYAAGRLGLSPGAVRSQLAKFGQALGRPWRADEKTAALAAWLALCTA